MREEYKIYQNTNIASFRFAKHLSIIMLVYGLLDLIIGSVLALIHVGIMYNLDTVMNSSPEANAIWVDSFEMVASWGFGETADMMLLIPFMLLLSYSRTHKHSAIDNLIPLVGVIALVLIYFDGIFQIVQTLLTEGLD